MVEYASCPGRMAAQSGYGNATSGKKECVLEGHSDLVISVTFSPDRSCVVSCSKDKSIQIWNVVTRKMCWKDI